MDLGALFRKAARLHGSQEAVVFEGTRLTYSQLYERASRLATALTRLGARPGDTVCTIEDNALESLEEICAMALGGFARSPLYSFNSVDQHIYAMNLVSARVLIVQERYWAALRPRVGEVPTLENVLVHGGDDSADYDRAIRETEPTDLEVRVAEDDLALIRFSAGTTGRPKAIAHSVRGWRQLAFETALAFPRLDEQDANLVIAPLSHATGLTVWWSIAAGVKHVVLPAFDPERVVDVIERERITHTMMVPTMIQMVVNSPGVRQRDMSSLRFLWYGGAPIATQTMVDATELWGSILYQAYGQSEASPISCLGPQHHKPDGSDDELRRLRSAGRPLPNVYVKILGSDGTELPAGEVGEIAVHTPGAMKEILNDPAATAARKTADGWIRTGDIGSVDAEGFLFIADRKEDLIISGGINIWPAEVEHALNAHPAVLEACVVGVPHEKFGETPKAVVVLRPDGQATASELVAWCREKVGPVRKPTQIEFVDALPKSPIGKVLRREVRSQLGHDNDRQFAGV